MPLFSLRPLSSLRDSLLHCLSGMTWAQRGSFAALCGGDEVGNVEGLVGKESSQLSIYSGDGSCFHAAKSSVLS